MENKRFDFDKKKFYTEEYGEVNMIAIILIIAVILVIAILFKEQMMNLLQAVFHNMENR